MPGLQEEIDTLSKRRIVDALKESRGNSRTAALALGIPRTTLMDKIRKFGLTDMVTRLKSKNGLKNGPGRPRRPRSGSLDPRRIRMMRMQGMSYSKIGEALGEPASTVRMVLLEDDGR